MDTGNAIRVGIPTNGALEGIMEGRVGYVDGIGTTVDTEGAVDPTVLP